MLQAKFFRITLLATCVVTNAVRLAQVQNEGTVSGTFRTHHIEPQERITHSSADEEGPQIFSPQQERYENANAEGAWSTASPSDGPACGACDR